MAFGGFDSQQRGSSMPHAEINMVPLIDVMLVLVVIFIVAAPLATHSVKVNLPRASTAPTQAAPYVAVAIRTPDEVFWNKERVSLEGLPQRFKQTAAQSGELPEVRFMVDKDVPHGVVAKVMAMASQSGLSRLVFVHQPESSQPLP